MSKPNYGIFVKIDRIKFIIDIEENRNNPYPFITTQFFDNLLHIFIFYLDDATLCNLLQINSFCDTFNLKKLITHSQFMERLQNGVDERRKKLQELYNKKIRRWSSVYFKIWSIDNYNEGNKGKDKDKTLRRIYCVSQLMTSYLDRKTDGIPDDILNYWTEYAQKRIQTNTKSKKFDTFGCGDAKLLKGWDTFNGKICSKKSLERIFMSGKAFGKDGKVLYSRVDRLLLGAMMELMVKEWIVIDGHICQDNDYDHHEEQLTRIFGWISPKCVVILGGPYKVNSFDYYDS